LSINLRSSSTGNARFDNIIVRQITSPEPILSAGVEQTNAATSFVDCGTLSSAGTYTLTQNISSDGTCFTIGANNIIINGSGYTINYSKTITGYGINGSNGFDNITIMNLNILQNSTQSNSFAVYFTNSSNITLQNNTISTYASDGRGVNLLTSKYIRILNNTITTLNGYGVYMESSNTSNSSDNDILTYGGSGYTFYLLDSSSNNIFNNNLSTLGIGSDTLYIQNSNLNSFSTNTVLASGLNSWGIYLTSSHLNNMSRNNISVSGSGGRGILLQLSNNAKISDNILVTTFPSNAHGIYFDRSVNNSITGGSIITNSSYDYFLANSDKTNNFTNTNFTTSKKIWLDDSSSGFNYNNETNGNIWLKTNISAASSINRTLINWTQLDMRWNDISSANINISYNITGLLALTNYNVLNGTTTQMITTDANGALGVKIILMSNIPTNLVVSNISEGVLTSCTCPTINTNWAVSLSDYCVISTDCNIGTGNITFIGTGNITIDGALITFKNMGALPINQRGFLRNNWRMRQG
jgi:hypothetical protein